MIDSGTGAVKGPALVVEEILQLNLVLLSGKNSLIHEFPWTLT